MTLYTIHCTRCQILAVKLKQAGLEFDTVDNINTVKKVMDEHNISSAPVLEVDNNFYDYMGAIKFLKEGK